MVGSLSAVSLALGLILALGTILAGLGYAIGSYRRERSHARGDALAAAIAESQVWREKSDRLDRVVEHNKTKIDELTGKTERQQTELAELRSLVMGPEAFERAVTAVSDLLLKGLVQAITTVSAQSVGEMKAELERLERFYLVPMRTDRVREEWSGKTQVEPD